MENHRVQDLFSLQPRQYLRNSLNHFSNSLRLLTASRSLLMEKEQAFPQNTQGVSGRGGTGNQVTFMPMLGAAHDPTQPSLSFL